MGRTLKFCCPISGLKVKAISRFILKSLVDLARAIPSCPFPDSLSHATTLWMYREAAHAHTSMKRYFALEEVACSLTKCLCRTSSMLMGTCMEKCLGCSLISGLWHTKQNASPFCDGKGKTQWQPHLGLPEAAFLPQQSLADLDTRGNKAASNGAKHCCSTAFYSAFAAELSMTSYACLFWYPMELSSR